jgi:hypothetical protein
LSSFDPYGFIDPGSLVAFINPFSPNPAITRALTGQSAFVRGRELLAQLTNEDDHRDLVVRLSSLIHERQHFHDLLLSPFGGRVFRAHLAVRLESTRLYVQLLADAETTEVRIPLAADSGLAASDLERVYGWQKTTHELLEHGRQTLEANAVLSQRLFVWDQLGAAALQALDDALSESLVYGATYQELDRLAAGALRHDVPIVAAARLLFTSALAQERPDDHLDESLWLLKSAVDGLVSVRQLDDLCATRLQHLLDACPGSVRKGVATASQIAGNLPASDSRDVLIDAVLDVVHLGEDMYRAVQAHPERLGTQEGLLNWPREEPLPEPLVCWFCPTDEDGLTPGEWDLTEGRVLDEVKVWAHPESGPMFVPRLIEDAYRLGDRVQRVQPAMALAELAGTEALLRDHVSLTHPLHGLFIRKARQRGLALIRR